MRLSSKPDGGRWAPVSVSAHPDCDAGCVAYADRILVERACTARIGKPGTVLFALELSLGEQAPESRSASAKADQPNAGAQGMGRARNHGYFATLFQGNEQVEGLQRATGNKQRIC